MPTCMHLRAESSRGFFRVGTQSLFRGPLRLVHESNALLAHIPAARPPMITDHESRTRGVVAIHRARTSPWESLCEDFGGPDRVDILHSLAAAPLKRKLAPPRRCLVSSNCKSVPAPSDIVSAAPILKKSSNRLSSLNCWRLSVPRYLSCSYALRAVNVQ